MTEFRARIALLTNSLLIRLVDSKAVRWDEKRRLRVALANNNEGKWWTAVSKLTVADLERRFEEKNVAGTLYQAVGGLLGDHRRLKTVGGHYLYMQLKWRDELVDVSLFELGITLRSPIRFDAIRMY